MTLTLRLRDVLASAMVATALSISGMEVVRRPDIATKSASFSWAALMNVAASISTPRSTT